MEKVTSTPTVGGGSASSASVAGGASTASAGKSASAPATTGPASLASASGQRVAAAQIFNDNRSFQEGSWLGVFDLGPVPVGKPVGSVTVTVRLYAISPAFDGEVTGLLLVGGEPYPGGHCDFPLALLAQPRDVTWTVVPVPGMLSDDLAGLAVRVDVMRWSAGDPATVAIDWARASIAYA